LRAESELVRREGTKPTLMSALISAARRTWLPTSLFVMASITIWWAFLDWDTARDHLVPTLLLSPVIWWIVVGHKRPIHLLRGLAAGALVGLITQIVPHLPYLIPLSFKPGAGDGEEQAAAMVSMVIYLTIGFCAAVVGAFVSLVVMAIDRAGIRLVFRRESVGSG
jgi:hypothetical protein